MQGYYPTRLMLPALWQQGTSNNTRTFTPALPLPDTGIALVQGVSLPILWRVFFFPFSNI
jgi:hypothetical protein